jgi:hypothetical protein
MGTSGNAPWSFLNTKKSRIRAFLTTDTLKPLIKTELEQMKSVNSVALSLSVITWLQGRFIFDFRFSEMPLRIICQGFTNEI